MAMYLFVSTSHTVTRAVAVAVDLVAVDAPPRTEAAAAAASSSLSSLPLPLPLPAPTPRSMSSPLPASSRTRAYPAARRRRLPPQRPRHAGVNVSGSGRSSLAGRVSSSHIHVPMRAMKPRHATTTHGSRYLYCRHSGVSNASHFDAGSARKPPTAGPKMRARPPLMPRIAKPRARLLSSHTSDSSVFTTPRFPLSAPHMKRAKRAPPKDCARPKPRMDTKEPTRPMMMIGRRPYTSLRRPHTSDATSAPTWYALPK
mmetsp:Transcript_2645/g.9233  ORF Transcript_2645/g.9233 Transcript_2645/m.9233 type:complete len:257 (-) Transcript_2645:364-1134(-)